MKPTTPTELLDEIRKLNDKFDKLQSDVCITKNVKNYFQTDLLTLNINAWEMASIVGGNA